jgi:hypothetical protein
MNRLFGLVLLLVMIGLTGCDYARMYDQDAIKTNKGKMPPMDQRTIPVGDSFQVLLHADPESLKNPLSYSEKSVEQGRLAYGYFCVQCHGPRLDGKGTVGQSFFPLPADLTSGTVLSKSDGVLYSEVRLGVGRHPRLFPTVSGEDAWAAIIYMRSKRGPS